MSKFQKNPVIMCRRFKSTFAGMFRVPLPRRWKGWACRGLRNSRQYGQAQSTEATGRAARADWAQESVGDGFHQWDCALLLSVAARKLHEGRGSYLLCLLQIRGRCALGVPVSISVQVSLMLPGGGGRLAGNHRAKGLEKSECEIR